MKSYNLNLGFKSRGRDRTPVELRGNVPTGDGPLNDARQWADYYLYYVDRRTLSDRLERRGANRHFDFRAVIFTPTHDKIQVQTADGALHAFHVTDVTFPCTQRQSLT